MSPRLRGALAGVSALAILGAGGFAIAQQNDEGAVTDEARAADVAIDRGYADLVEAVMPAVVSVKVQGRRSPAAMMGGENSPFNNPEMEEFFERFFGRPMPSPGPQQRPFGRRMEGQGSGFVIDKGGYVVTNAHVVDGAERTIVVMQDGTEYDAELVGADEKTDLALIKIESDADLPFVEFADSSEVRVGERVVAVGNPFGLGGTVTAGIVSATDREVGAGPYDDYLQIDAPINRGNSGGPTFDLDGKVVGVNTLIFSPSGGSVGIGFAIASNLVQEIVADLKDDGQIERGFLGVQIQTVDEDLAQALDLDSDKGALVAEVFDDSPAAKAGVQRGDVIVSFNDKPIERLRDLTTAVARTEPGQSAEMAVWRDGKRQTLEVEVALMPSDDDAAAQEAAEEAAKPRLGLSLAPLSPAVRDRLGLDQGVEGVLVAGVQPGSPAAEKGLREGDVILEVSGRKVADPETVVQAVEQAAKDGEELVLMAVRRDDASLFVAVPFDAS